MGGKSHYCMQSDKWEKGKSVIMNVNRQRWEFNLMEMQDCNKDYLRQGEVDDFTLFQESVCGKGVLPDPKSEEKVDELRSWSMWEGQRYNTLLKNEPWKGLKTFHSM